jgi:glycosyltransferase involved in cell wall biosynthesis
VVGAFRRAVLVVVPSRWPDPLPTVAIEALTVGTPVVAARTGGLPELVSDGVEGFLFSPGDGAAMRAALERILSQPELRQRMSTAARAKGAAFAASSVVPRIEAAYGSVISGRGELRSGVMAGHHERRLST